MGEADFCRKSILLHKFLYVLQTHCAISSAHDAEMALSKMVIGSRSAAIFHNHHNGEQKVLPILLVSMMLYRYSWGWSIASDYDHGVANQWHLDLVTKSIIPNVKHQSFLLLLLYLENPAVELDPPQRFSNAANAFMSSSCWCFEIYVFLLINPTKS